MFFANLIYKLSKVAYAFLGKYMWRHPYILIAWCVAITVSFASLATIGIVGAIQVIYTKTS